jgi:hypothetical protein
MANYTTPKITQSVFNSSDYIDTAFLTKTEADNLYINELPESVEKLIGNLNIIGEETVTSQVVTGNSSIGGNETITGTIKAGYDNNAIGNIYKHSGIHGHVWLGDSEVNTTTTILNNLKVDGIKTIALAGSTTNINTVNNVSSTQCNIGREGGVHTTNIKGNVKLGDETNTSSTTEALGRVILGYSQPVDIRGSVVSINIETANGPSSTIIGNGSGDVTLNSSNVIVGNNNLPTSTTQIRGKTIAIGNDLTTGGIQIGRGALVANAVDGQTNTFVSSQNKIFNPRLCNAWGELNTQRDFCLNSPSFCCYSAGTRYVGASVTLPVLTTKTIYLNVPDLTNTMTYPILMDLSHFVYGGFPTTNTISTKLVGYTAGINAGTFVGTEARSKSIASNLVLCVAKNSTSSAHDYYFLPNINNTVNPFGSQTIKLKVNGTATNYDYYPFAVSKVSETKLRINVAFPQASRTWSVNGANSTGANNEFVYALGFSVRLLGSPTSTNDTGIFPSTSSDSSAGSCYLSLT